MLIADGAYLKLYPWRVRHKQYGDTIEQWALPDKQWWVDFAVKWDHTEIIEFIEIKLTEEQLERVAEIEAIPLDEGYRSMAIEYILHGVFPEGMTHPLRGLQIEKEQQKLRGLLADLTEIVLLGGM